MNTEAIQKICDEYMEYLKSDEYFSDNDWIHYIYEAVMAAVFGETIWERIRDIDRERTIKEKKEQIARLQAEVE